MNKQREIFYARRYKLLELSDDNAGISEKIDEILKGEISTLVTIYSPDGISQDESNVIIKEFQEILPLDPYSSRELEKKLTNSDQQSATKILEAVISQAREAQENHFGEILKQIEVQVALSTYDELWMQHLDAIDDLRDGIGLRGYAQKDPLVEYKAEAFNLFESLLDRINYQIARRIFRVQLVRTPPPSMPTKEIHESNSETTTASDNTPKTNTLGRNDPCWCGSGKKWKRCHYPQLN
jgi:preprotein translocase subunit SecA